MYWISETSVYLQLIVDNWKEYDQYSKESFGEVKLNLSKNLLYAESLLKRIKYTKSFVIIFLN